MAKLLDELALLTDAVDLGCSLLGSVVVGDLVRLLT